MSKYWPPPRDSAQIYKAPEPRLRTKYRAPAPHAPSPRTHKLWDTLRLQLARVIKSFGFPAALAALIWITPFLRRAADKALRPLERLARLILLIEAAEAPPGVEAKSRALSEAREPQDSGHVQDPDDPPAWRAPFKLAPRPAPAHAGQSHNANPAPARVFSAPIAERIEALLRVIDDPGLYVRRLARKLARLAPRVLQKLTQPPHGDETAPLQAARLHARDALAPFCNSS